MCSFKRGFPVDENTYIAVCSFERGFPSDESTYLSVCSLKRGFPAEESKSLAVCSLERGLPSTTYIFIDLIPRNIWRLKKSFCCSFFTNHAVSLEENLIEFQIKIKKKNPI